MMEDQKSLKQTAAKLIRTITVPPVLIFVLAVLLNAVRDDIFLNDQELIMSLIFLAFLPVLAYPLQKLIPGLKEKGREGQRNLAFLLSLIGYSAALVYGLSEGCSKKLLLIYLTYFLSVVILVVLNKVLKLRASGHACSITGPIVFLCYFLGWIAVIPCVLLYLLILWASVVLGRHTSKEFTLGTLACVISFVCSVLITSVF